MKDGISCNVAKKYQEFENKIQMKQYARALEIYEEQEVAENIKKLSINDILNWKLHAAICYEQQYNFKKCNDIYTNVDIQWRNRRFYIQYARFLVTLKDFDEAENKLKMVQNWRDDLGIQQIFAYIYEHRGGIGDKERAIRILKNNPNWQNDDNVLISLFHIYLKQWAFKEALKTLHCKSDWEKDPQFARCKAICLGHSGKHRESIKVLKDYLEKYQENADSIKICLGRAYIIIGNFSEAEKIYQSISNWRKKRDPLLGLGILHVNKGKSKNEEEAKIEYNKAIDYFKKIEPTDIDARLCIGKTHLLLKNYKAAEETFLSIPEENSKACLMYARSLYARKSPDTFSYLIKICEKYPTQSKLKLELIQY